MRDWKELVRQKTASAGLTPSQKEEVAVELASHLEEIYEEQLANGVAEGRAAEEAMRAIGDWEKLKRRVRRAKVEEELMNNRTKQLWLPGFAGFWTAMICELALNRLGFGPLTGGPMFHYRLPQLNYLIWLIAEFGCGALAAYLSRRAGGARSTRVAAALFTTGILLATMIIVIAICAIGRATGLAFASLDFMLLIKPVVIVVLLPSAAMLVGALPFLSETNRTAIVR